MCRLGLTGNSIIFGFQRRQERCSCNYMTRRDALKYLMTSRSGAGATQHSAVVVNTHLHDSAPTLSNACSLMCVRVAFRILCSPVRQSGTASFLLADRQRVTTSAVIGLVCHDAALPAIKSPTAASRGSPSTGSLSGPQQQAVLGIAQVIFANARRADAD